MTDIITAQDRIRELENGIELIERERTKLLLEAERLKKKVSRMYLSIKRIEDGVKEANNGSPTKD